jgi:hypothetical protein
VCSRVGKGFGIGSAGRIKNLRENKISSRKFEKSAGKSKNQLEKNFSSRKFYFPADFLIFQLMIQISSGRAENATDNSPKEADRRDFNEIV